MVKLGDTSDLGSDAERRGGSSPPWATKLYNLRNKNAERYSMSNEILKDAVRDGKRVSFVKYFDGDLWYRTENDITFPVPIKEIGSATFLADDKALLFMRYIRKHLDSLSETSQG